MQKRFTFLILLLLSLISCRISAQQQNRIQNIQNHLDELAATVPGLNDIVVLSVNGVSLQEFITGLARSNKLSISVDPRINVKVTNNFNNVTPANILLFLAKTYNLDVSFTGSIINITPYNDPNLNYRPLKDIKAKYNNLDNTLSLELDNDTLASVAKKIAQISGKNVVVTPALINKKVSGFITNAPFEAALDKLAYTNDIKMQRTADNFYMFQTLGENEELYVNGDRNTSVRKTFKPAGTGTGGNLGLFTRMIGGQKLISLDATNASIQDLVKSASQELGKNYTIYSDIKGTITSHLTDVTYENFLGALFKGTDYTFRAENGVYMIGDRKLEGLRNNRVIVLQNRSIDTVVAMIPVEWKKGVEIKEFREQNTLLLSGSAPQISELENYIKQLDLLVPMIMTEITLVDINKGRTVATGLKIGVADSVKTGGTLLSGFDFTFGASSINNFLDKVGGSYVNLGHVVPNFYASIKALESLDNVEVHSIPKLTTLNGHSASSSLGSTRYYLIQTQNVIPSLTSPTSIYTQQYNKVDANMVINIKPIVSGDDQITTNIKIDITDFIGTPPANAPPPTSTSKFESIIRAHDGDMIVLGGLERTVDSENASGTPLLSRIPIIKWFFSTRTKQHQKIVTLVFIKSTIIH